MFRTITTSLLGVAIIGAGQAAWAGDIPGDKSTKATLPVSVARTLGTLERAGDSDWYRVTLKGDTDYTVDVSPPETGYGFIEANLRDASGKVLASATIDATTGITGPNGTVNFGGATTWIGSLKCAPTCAAISRSRLRKTSVATHTARYITSRAIALTDARATNDPLSASTSATPAPNRIAFDGVR